MWPLFLGLRPFNLKILIKSYQFKGLKSKNKDQTNFYECCDLTKKVYLVAAYAKNSQLDTQSNTILTAMLLLTFTLIRYNTVGFYTKSKIRAGAIRIFFGKLLILFSLSLHYFLLF